MSLTANHPCFSETAHHFYSRVHLPVAAKCNIQCNYCNRKHDCANESRPGVTSRLLSPEEAFHRVLAVASKRRDLSVIGIAGPGDALANPRQTFRTFKLIKHCFPDLLFCLSTNGLNLVQHIDDITRLGIDHVTVTVNTMKPATAARIYSWVTIDGKRSAGGDAMHEFLNRQQLGIKALVENNITVKVNSILMPGINDVELKSLAKRLKLMGVSLHNISPLIAEAEHGTRFGLENQPVPDADQLEAVRKQCGVVKQMAHCRQCRADAVGRLGCEVKEEVPDENNPGILEGDYGFANRKNWRRMVDLLTMSRTLAASCEQDKDRLPDNELKIAVCTRGSGFADLEVAKAKEFYIYQVVSGQITLINIRKTDLTCSAFDVEKTLGTIRGCRAILSNRFEYKVFKAFEAGGILPISDLSNIPIKEAITETIQRFARQKEYAVTRRRHHKGTLIH